MFEKPSLQVKASCRRRSFLFQLRFTFQFVISDWRFGIGARFQGIFTSLDLLYVLIFISLERPTFENVAPSKSVHSRNKVALLETLVLKSKAQAS